jgi:putative phosphotransacetylase
MTKLNVPLPREQVERIVRQILRQQMAGRLAAGQVQMSAAYGPNLVVNISARHMHLTQEHLDKLFGPGSQLTVYRWLYQPGEFASEQTVTVIGPRRRMIENIRILGPVRKYSQLEISFTDSISLGIDAPVRPSGKIDGTPGILVLGPKGSVELPYGVIRAQRHVHMSPAEAEALGFKDGQYVRLRVDSPCAMTFERVLCRVDPKVLLEVHLDTDEGNACDLVNATNVELLA